MEVCVENDQSPAVGVVADVAELARMVINPEVARCALDGVEKRLADLNDIRKSTETKQTSLFSVYVSLSMAVCGIGAAMAQNAAMAGRASYFLLAAMPFVIGAALFGWAQMPMIGGMAGSDPKMWLQRGRIDAPSDQEAAKMRAYLVIHYAQRIKETCEGNAKKQALLNWGLACGLLGAVGFGSALYGAFMLATPIRP